MIVVRRAPLVGSGRRQASHIGAAVLSSERGVGRIRFSPTRVHSIRCRLLPRRAHTIDERAPRLWLSRSASALRIRSQRNAQTLGCGYLSAFVQLCKLSGVRFCFDCVSLPSVRHTHQSGVSEETHNTTEKQHEIVIFVQQSASQYCARFTITCMRTKRRLAAQIFRVDKSKSCI